jgi:pimeloyl-ACP methyl ester carboxylesterase
MDPRGLGLSTPIKCDPTIGNERISYFPTTDAEFERLVAHNKALGQSCLDLTGPLAGYVDTVSVAHDVEAVRIALDEGDLNYLGLSYGTQLGSQYAELYPNNIRAMVLDGNVDHGTTETNMWVVESSTAEDEFKRFASYCGTNSKCPLYGQNVTDVFIKLIDQAAIEPIPAPGCITSSQCQPNVTNEDILFGLEQFLVFKDSPPAFVDIGWNFFGQAISEAASGNATLLSAPYYTSPISPNFLGQAVECLDWNHTSADSLAKLKYKKQLVSVISPLTGGGSQSYYVQASCVGWPMPVTNPLHFMNITTTKTVLMVNSYHDPECSYVWANSLKEQFQNAVLLTREGDGHTSYFLQGDTTAAIDAYLVNGIVPPDNTVLPS